MRRSRARTVSPVLCIERGRDGARLSGELRRRHHLGADGIYRGVKYFQPETGELGEEDES